MKPVGYFWAVVGDNKTTEPVFVRLVDGERLAFTCGCSDPFPVDVKTPAILLVREERPLEPLLTPAAADAARRREEALREEYRRHGYMVKQ